MSGFSTDGIAAGLQAGFSMAQSVQDRKDRKAQQDREYGLKLEDRADARARQAVADERSSADYAVRAADDEKKSTVSRFSNIATQYGSFEAAPPEVQSAAVEAARKADDLIEKSRTKRNDIAFGKQRQDLSNVISNLQTGRVSIDDVTPGTLYQAVANATRRDPTDFMSGPDGAPSPVSKAVGDVTTGMETSNKGLMLQGANVLLAPELRRGVGTESAHGGKILAKEIVDFVPHPNDPSRTTPVIKVYVDEGKNVVGPRGPHGATSYYLAPLTEDRSSNPDATVGFLDLKSAMDRVGQMGQLAVLMNQPQFRARMEEGRQQAGPQTKELIDRYFTEGERDAPKKTITTKDTRIPADGGYTLRDKYDARGRLIGQEKIQHPDRPARTAALEVRLDTIDRLEKEGEFSAAEAEEARQAALGIRPRVGRGGRGGGGSGKLTETETRGLLKDVERHIASQVGLQISPITKGWVNPDGSPPRPDQMKTFQEAYNKASDLVRDNASENKKTSKTAATEVAAPAASASAKTVKWGDLKK